jgi:hypothetical protein
MPHNPASIVRLLYDAHEAEHKPDGSGRVGLNGQIRPTTICSKQQTTVDSRFVPIKFFVSRLAQTNSHPSLTDVPSWRPRCFPASAPFLCALCLGRHGDRTSGLGGGARSHIQPEKFGKVFPRTFVAGPFLASGNSMSAWAINSFPSTPWSLKRSSGCWSKRAPIP